MMIDTKAEQGQIARPFVGGRTHGRLPITCKEWAEYWAIQSLSHIRFGAGSGVAAIGLYCRWFGSFPSRYFADIRLLAVRRLKAVRSSLRDGSLSGPGLKKPNVKDHGAAVIDFPFKTDDDGRSRGSFCSRKPLRGGGIVRFRCFSSRVDVRVAEFFRKFSFLRKDNVMNSESWDVRMDGDMVIAGLSERTREPFLRAARQLAKFH
jgi:hypothetical protein